MKRKRSEFGSNRNKSRKLNRSDDASFSSQRVDSEINKSRTSLMNDTLDTEEIEEQENFEFDL